MKKLSLGIGLGLLVVLIAVVVVGFALDGIVKRGVETFGPKLTKVDIKLDKCSLSLFSGSGKIDGLFVGNPPGFKTPQALLIGSASLSLSPGSLLSRKILIKSLKIEAPDITLETGAGGSNLKKILANLNESTGSGDASAKSKESAQGRKIEVDDLLITGAKLHLAMTGLGSATVPLPDIHLTDLGKGDEGITPAELSKRVLAAVEQSSTKTAADSAAALAKGAANAAKSAVGGTKNALTNTAGKIGNLFNKN